MSKCHLETGFIDTFDQVRETFDTADIVSPVSIKITINLFITNLFLEIDFQLNDNFSRKIKLLVKLTHL